jgi:hypothetical protein
MATVNGINEFWVLLPLLWIFVLESPDSVGYGAIAPQACIPVGISVMINFMCRLDWAIEEMLFLGLSGKVFPDKISKYSGLRM